MAAVGRAQGREEKVEEVLGGRDQHPDLERRVQRRGEGPFQVVVVGRALGAEVELDAAVEALAEDVDADGAGITGSCSPLPMRERNDSCSISLFSDAEMGNTDYILPKQLQVLQTSVIQC